MKRTRIISMLLSAALALSSLPIMAIPASAAEENLLGTADVSYSAGAAAEVISPRSNDSGSYLQVSNRGGDLSSRGRFGLAYRTAGTMKKGVEYFVSFWARVSVDNNCEGKTEKNAEYLRMQLRSYNSQNGNPYFTPTSNCPAGDYSATGPDANGYATQTAWIRVTEEWQYYEFKIKLHNVDQVNGVIVLQGYSTNEKYSHPFDIDDFKLWTNEDAGSGYITKGAPEFHDFNNPDFSICTSSSQTGVFGKSAGTSMEFVAPDSNTSFPTVITQVSDDEFSRISFTNEAASNPNTSAAYTTALSLTPGEYTLSGDVRLGYHEYVNRDGDGNDLNAASVAVSYNEVKLGNVAINNEWTPFAYKITVRTGTLDVTSVKFLADCSEAIDLRGIKLVRTADYTSELVPDENGDNLLAGMQTVTGSATKNEAVNGADGEVNGYLHVYDRKLGVSNNGFKLDLDGVSLAAGQTYTVAFRARIPNESEKVITLSVVGDVISQEYYNTTLDDNQSNNLPYIGTASNSKSIPGGFAGGYGVVITNDWVEYRFSYTPRENAVAPCFAFVPRYTGAASSSDYRKSGSEPFVSPFDIDDIKIWAGTGEPAENTTVYYDGFNGYSDVPKKYAPVGATTGAILTTAGDAKLAIEAEGEFTRIDGSDINTVVAYTDMMLDAGNYYITGDFRIGEYDALKATASDTENYGKITITTVVTPYENDAPSGEPVVKSRTVDISAETWQVVTEYLMISGCASAKVDVKFELDSTKTLDFKDITVYEDIDETAGLINPGILMLLLLKKKAAQAPVEPDVPAEPTKTSNLIENGDFSAAPTVVSLKSDVKTTGAWCEYDHEGAKRDDKGLAIEGTTMLYDQTIAYNEDGYLEISGRKFNQNPIVYNTGVTLDAGTYKLSVDVKGVGTLSRLRIVPCVSGSLSNIYTPTPFALTSDWQTHTAEFTINEATTVSIKIWGGTSTSDITDYCIDNLIIEKIG